MTKKPIAPEAAENQPKTREVVGEDETRPIPAVHQKALAENEALKREVLRLVQDETPLMAGPLLVELLEDIGAAFEKVQDGIANMRYER